MKLVQMNKKTKAQALRDMKQVGVNCHLNWIITRVTLVSACRPNPWTKGERYELPPSQTYHAYALSGEQIYPPQNQMSKNFLTANFQRFLFGFVHLWP